MGVLGSFGVSHITNQQDPFESVTGPYGVIVGSIYEQGTYISYEVL